MLKEWILWIPTTQILFSSIFVWHILPTQASKGCPVQPCKCGDYCFNGTIITCSGCNPVCNGECCTGPGPEECFQCSGQCSIFSATTSTATATTSTATATTSTSRATTITAAAKLDISSTATITPDTTINLIATTTIQTKTLTGSIVTSKIFQALSSPSSTSTESNQSTTNSTSGTGNESGVDGLTVGLGVSSGLAGIIAFVTAICKCRDPDLKCCKSIFQTVFSPCCSKQQGIETTNKSKKRKSDSSKKECKKPFKSIRSAPKHDPNRNKVIPIDSFSHFWVEIHGTQSKCSFVKHHYITTRGTMDISKIWEYILLSPIKTVVFFGKLERFLQYGKSLVQTDDFHLKVQEPKKADFSVWVIENRENKRRVRLYEFTAWPDNGVPDNPLPFIKMRRKIREHIEDDSSPILVKSETDDGRVGVYVAVDSLIQQHTINGHEEGINVYSFLHTMSTTPEFKIDTYKQYAFICESVFIANETRLDVNKFKGKNIPPKFCGCFQLGTQRPDIKHICVDGYRKKIKIILTKTPQRKTIADFWRLVVDNNVQAIVMIGSNKHDNDYWSDGSVEIEKTSFCSENKISNVQHDIIIRKLKIPKKEPIRNQPDIVQFHFKNWAMESSPFPVSEKMAKDLVILVLSYQKLRKLPTILVHCKDGITHSGLFVALLLLSEKIIEEKDEDVDDYLTSMYLAQQPQLILSDSQFQYCYKCLPGLKKRVKKVHQFLGEKSRISS